MTGSALLLYISTAIFLQILLLGGASFLRYRAAVRQASANSDVAASSTSGASWAGWREFRVARRAYEDLQRSQCSFYLEPVDGIALPTFKPGQFLTFQLDTPSQTLTRCYSLSDRPSTEHYRVTIKRQSAPAGLPDLLPGLASNHFHSAIQPGDILRVRAPAGAFFVDPDASHDIVLIAGGIGITPLLSMLRWCLDEQPMRGIYLYYGLRGGDEHVFKHQLAQLTTTHPNFHLLVAYSQPGPDDQLGRDFQHQGHVDLDLIKKSLPHGHHQFYICGPAPMMQSLVPALAAWGVAPADIHFEAFGPASIGSVSSTADVSLPAIQGGTAQSFEVQFLQSARTLLWTADSGTLLDFAETNGIEVEFGCRAGSCGACETRLISGNICYAEKPDYDIGTGKCLLCVGTPSSNLVLAA
jgi:ferredoxin-NADP reductase